MRIRSAAVVVLDDHALAVRQRKWVQLRSLTLREYRTHERYSYLSWIRHALTTAARAGILQTANAGTSLRSRPVLSRALQLATRHPEFRPDIQAGEAESSELLDSLCAFELLWCTIAQSESERQDGSDFYPSSAELDQEHANAAFLLVAEDAEVREQLFSGKSEKDFASLVYVFEFAYRQAMQHPGWWSGLPDTTRHWASSVGAERP